MRIVNLIAQVGTATLVFSGAGVAGPHASAQGQVQSSMLHTQLGTALGGGLVNAYQVEVRYDLSMRDESWRLVARPRLRWHDVDADVMETLLPRRASFTEIYGTVTSSSTTRLTLGKRYQGWGPGLLYSPSNRLFPDNGFTTPRQEVDGKWMVSGSWTLRNATQASLTVANLDSRSSPDLRRSNATVLLRAEHLATGASETGWGFSVGKGGGLRTYLGGYAQQLIGDSITVAVEASASKGYSRSLQDAGLPGSDAGRLAGDLLVSVRYGLPTGGEYAVEFVHNGFRLSTSELQSLAFMGSSGAVGSAAPSIARHPLYERRYLNLQLSLTKLFGNAQWSALARHVVAIDSGGHLSFVELAYSLSDQSSLYWGATVASGSASSSLRRALHRATYLAFEINF